MRSVVLLLLVLAVGMPHAVSGQTIGGLPGLSRAICELYLNGRRVVEVPIGMREHDVFVPQVILQEAGLKWSTATTLSIADELYVSLASLAPRVKFELDLANAELRLTAAAESFSAATEIVPSMQIDAPDRSRPVSGFVNYAATVSERQEIRWGTELALRAGSGLLHTSASGLGSAATGRGTTSLTFDDERRLVRWEIGDTTAVSTVGDQAISVAGLTLSRELGINPETHPFVPLLMTGSTAVPATADVYINGQLTAQVPVDPGTFQVKDFALPVGGGDVRIVVRDDFGRQQELTRNYYRSPNLLRPGLQTFRYSVGAPLALASRFNWSYRGLVAIGEHQVGVSESVTLGASAGYSKRALFGGVSAAARLPLGETEVEIRTSRTRDRAGVAASVLYILRGRRLSAHGTLRLFSTAYEELRPRNVAFEPDSNAGVSINATLGHGVNLGTQYLRWQNRTITRQEFGVNLGVGLPASSSLSVSATHNSASSRPFTVLATLTVPIGSRSSASAIHQSTAAGAAETNVAVQRALPLGPGAGYRVQAQQGLTNSGSAVVQYQNGWGRVEARADGSARHQARSLNMSGAVAMLRQGVFLTRPIDDAFALVQVPGFRGVRAYTSNQLVGRTDRDGNVVVPTLGSYRSNRIVIDDGDLPFQIEVDRIESVLAPGLRGAGVATFGVTRTTGTLEDVLRQLERMEGSGGNGPGGDAGLGGVSVVRPSAQALGGPFKRRFTFSLGHSANAFAMCTASDLMPAAGLGRSSPQTGSSRCVSNDQR